MKLLECPNCKNTGLKVITVNQFKKRHYYIVWCWNCDWSQKFTHRLGFSGSGKAFMKHFLEGHEPIYNEEELRLRGRLND